ncbi:HAMP domain-containing histidine kinase [Mesobacillus subterraneus]|uniref:sensor histidine kinase n=1 Tax=Mesobacillus subterraneus TaxID=285983 RepID=UPI00203E9E44|nr:HAMP domain-containing sensor histidine kinase [Mesobacillus subterraneus]MCM3667243.1 HAMP domain-containing histidine kinase [Mesobacillus subterraneus]MCM3686176.1 HAMP domain-containing histidine kinase [Mesobacillus subterraneus]
MKLKKKYQLTLVAVIISVPISLLLINLLMLGFYKVVSKIRDTNTPFHESFAYPTMHVLFLLSFLLLAIVFSKTIHSLLKNISTLNSIILNLASNERVPNKIEITSEDEIGELTNSVNLLIERTASREMELKQQEEMQREYLNKLRHDINTPLTAIRLQLFYLEGENTSLPLESLYQQIEYIADLTNEFNRDSIDSMDSSYILYTEVNISDLMRDMIKKWDYLYRINQIKLQYHPHEKNLVWSSHKLLLQRLFDNAFQNALKHSKANKMEITINDGVVSMNDNGQGFAQKKQIQGLGLKVIDDLAKILNIKYTLQTSAEGTEFTFIIDQNIECVEDL